MIRVTDIDMRDLEPQNPCWAPSSNDQREYTPAYSAYPLHMCAWVEGMPVALLLHTLTVIHSSAVLCPSGFARRPDRSRSTQLPPHMSMAKVDGGAAAHV